MQLSLAPLLPLALSLGCIHVHQVPEDEHPHPTSHLAIPPLTSDITYDYPDLVAYAKAQSVIGDNVPLVTPEFELKLLSDAAGEVQHLDMYDDNQRARLSAIFQATRTIIKQRSALPITIDPDTDPNTPEQLAAQFEVTFLEYSSLSRSPTWAKFCMAALLGKDTLIRVLPCVSEGFFTKHKYLMLQAAAVLGNFDIFHAVATHYKISSDSLQWYITDDFLFSGSVDFVQKIATFYPILISNSSSLLSAVIRLNHQPLFEYLYDQTKKQVRDPWDLDDRLRGACQALASRGWEDEFKQFYRDYPQYHDVTWCLDDAAKHGRINILKYLLCHEELGCETKSDLDGAFAEAVGNGNIDAIKFLLEYDERKNSKRSVLSFTQPNGHILNAAGESGRWNGIEYLMEQKIKGDARFAAFKLAGKAACAVKYACSNGNLKVLKQLLQKDSQGQFVFTFDAPEVLRSSFIYACMNGHLPIVQELLKYSDVVPAAWINGALIVACKKGHYLIVRELLQMDNDGRYICNVDPAANDNQALVKACKKGHFLVVRELLQHERVAPDARGGKPLIAACRGGHLLVVRELLQKRDGKYVYNVDPAVNDNEALIAACEDGNLLVVRELLQHKGVDPSARYHQPLIAACGKGHLLVAQELLQRDNTKITSTTLIQPPEKMHP